MVILILIYIIKIEIKKEIGILIWICAASDLLIIPLFLNIKLQRFEGKLNNIQAKDSLKIALLCLNEGTGNFKMVSISMQR